MKPGDRVYVRAGPGRTGGEGTVTRIASGQAFSIEVEFTGSAWFSPHRAWFTPGELELTRPHFGGTAPHRYEAGRCVYCNATEPR